MFKSIRIILAGIVIILSLSFFIYPAVTVGLLMVDSQLKHTGQSAMVPRWFETTSRKYNNWAEAYLRSGYAEHVDKYDVAATEWPMFGSVFFLLSAEALQEQNRTDVLKGEQRRAVDHAARIVASEATATWVKKLWKRRYLKTGVTYLEKENVFYRMLFIMGLASYEKITADRQYHARMMGQARTLAHELSRAKHALADDYPGQCYPVDLLWAVAAIRKADAIESVGTDLEALTAALVGTLENMAPDAVRLPPFQVDAKSAIALQDARGSGTSGLFQFMPMLEFPTAQRWYAAYTHSFWKTTPWLSGFREFPQGATAFEDVDSGPIIDGIGSVATAFGIGASRGMGRLDQTVPLTLEVVAFGWPTPFGFLVPSVAGKIAADSWVLGDTALMFTMTRPVHADAMIPFEGGVPLGVWLVMLGYFVVGGVLIWIELKALRRLLNKRERKEHVYQ
jgi:hypothetical protein